MTARLPTCFVGQIVRMLLIWALLVVISSPLGRPADATVTSPGELDLPATRIAGPTREATAVALHDALVRAGGALPSRFVLVPADEPAIALSAAGLAGRLDAGVLLAADPPATVVMDLLDAAQPEEILIVAGAGGEASWPDGATVTRIDAPGGPPAVAAAMLRETVRRTGVVGEVVLAAPQGLVDAVAGAPLAHERGAPVLLTDGSALDPHAAFVLDQHPPSLVHVLGGPAVIGDDVVAAVRERAGSVDRIAGADRQGTARAVAAARGWDGQQVAVAGGPEAVDGIAAGAWAAGTGTAIIPADGAPRSLAARCGTGTTLRILGGTGVVGDAVVDQVRRALERCEGPDAPASLRVAVATPGRPGATAEVVGAITDPRGWASPRLRIDVVAEAHTVGVIIADEGCGGPAACRRGRDLVVDGATWDAAAPDLRVRLLNLLLGHRLGKDVAMDCDATVMAPLRCGSAPSWPSDDERLRAADRLVPGATLAFAGDVHGERQIAQAVAAGTNPLRFVAQVLQAADLAVVNLETPLSVRGAPVPKTYTFRGPPAMAAMLAEAGVDVVSLANNHGLDYGPVAMLDTLDHTAAAGVDLVGAGADPARAYRAAVHDTPAGRVAVVGLTRVLHTRAWEVAEGRPGLASGYDEPAAVAAVQAAGAAADHVVVAIHWGQELAGCPDANQRHLARLLVDAGADVIVGHHPHILQGVQVLDGAVVAYSLGNFVWYHDRAPSRWTGVLQVDLPLLDAPAWRLAPAQIHPDGAPRLLDPAGDGRHILDTVAARSPGGAAGCAFPA